MLYLGIGILIVSLSYAIAYAKVQIEETKKDTIEKQEITEAEYKQIRKKVLYLCIMVTILFIALYIFNELLAAFIADIKGEILLMQKSS